MTARFNEAIRQWPRSFEFWESGVADDQTEGGSPGSRAVSRDDAPHPVGEDADAAADTANADATFRDSISEEGLPKVKEAKPAKTKTKSTWSWVAFASPTAGGRQMWDKALPRVGFSQCEG